MRRLLRPAWLLTHLLVLSIAVGFVSLGLWQLRRHDDVARRNAVIEAQLQDPPVDVRVLLSGDAAPDFRSAIATGSWIGGADVMLSPRSRNDAPGYEVLTPLRLASDGRVVMVNRGWMPLDTEAPPPPEGTVTVAGRLRAPVEASRTLTEDGRIVLVSAVDLAALSGQVQDLTTVAYLVRVDPVALADGSLPRPALEVVLDGGPHLLYALQWFAFTIIGLVGYPLLLRRRILDERSGPAAEPPALV